jgi:hypothetical protein
MLKAAFSSFTTRSEMDGAEPGRTSERKGHSSFEAPNAKAAHPTQFERGRGAKLFPWRG